MLAAWTSHIPSSRRIAPRSASTLQARRPDRSKASQNSRQTDIKENKENIEHRRSLSGTQLPVARVCDIGPRQALPQPVCLGRWVNVMKREINIVDSGNQRLAVAPHVV